MEEIDESNEDDSTITIINRKILSDDDIVENCGFTDTSAIEVLDLTKVNIIVETIDGKKVPFDIRKSEKIKTLKNTIKEDTKFDDKEHYLKHENSMLEFDDEKIGDRGIKENSVITIVPRKLNTKVIHAHLCNNNNVDLEVCDSDTIICIKQKIGEKTKLSSDNLEALFEKKILENDDTIDDCKILDGSVIDIIDKLCDLRIFAMMPEGHSIPFTVSTKETIKDLKKKIDEKTGLPSSSCFIEFDKQALTDHQTIGESELKMNSFLNVYRDAILIRFQTMDGMKNDILIPKQCKIIDVKAKLQNTIKISPLDQLLIFRTSILEDDKTIDDYNVTENCIIIVIDKSSKSKFSVKQIYRNPIAFSFSENIKIIDIKKRMKEKTGLLVAEQIFEFEGQILEDDKTLGHYNIGANSVINDVSTTRKDMLICIKRDSKTETLNVIKGNKISDISRNVSEIWQLNKDDEEVFIYRGEILDDHHTIDDKTVEHGSISEKNIIEIMARKRDWKITFTYKMETYQLNVENIEKVIVLKRRIQSKINVRVDDQILKWKDKILRDDDMRLYKYGIDNNSIVEVSVKSDDCINVTIIIDHKEAFTLVVFKKSTIKEVKAMIENKTKILQKDQELWHILFWDNIEAATSSTKNEIRKEIRGVCVIINNESFGGGYKKRNGTNIDVDNITRTFQHLGYKIKIYPDVGSFEIDEKISLIKAEVKKSHKMLIVFVLSHGDDGVVIFSDGQKIPYDVIWKPFANENFRILNGKPKLFFFVSCQGGNLNSAINIEIDFDECTGLETDGNVCNRVAYPGIADVFFGYPTCSSFLSGRYRKIGTIYVDKLCDVVRRHSDWSVTDIHQEVQRLVSLDLIEDYSAYQMPYFTNLLTSHAYFIDKPY